MNLLAAFNNICFNLIAEFPLFDYRPRPQLLYRTTPHLACTPAGPLLPSPAPYHPVLQTLVCEQLPQACRSAVQACLGSMDLVQEELAVFLGLDPGQAKAGLATVPGGGRGVCGGEAGWPDRKGGGTGVQWLLTVRMRWSR